MLYGMVWYLPLDPCRSRPLPLQHSPLQLGKRHVRLTTLGMTIAVTKNVVMVDSAACFGNIGGDQPQSRAALADA